METEKRSNNEIKKTVTKSPVKLTRVFENEYQAPGTATAEFKQTIETKSFYPSRTVSDSLNDNPFDAVEDFGFEAQEYNNTSTRVAWIVIPKSWTEEIVNEKLKGKTLCIQQHISNHPILTDKQEYGIKAGKTTKDVIAARQILRYPEGAKNEKGEDVSGQIILDSSSGKPIYRVNAMKTSLVEDNDLRNDDPKDYYLSEELEQELAQLKELESSSNELFNG